MKSFKKFVAEVAQPKSKDEKDFKDQHEYEVVAHPVAEPSQHTGAIGASDLPRDKASRKADQKGDANYDKKAAKKDDDGVKLESTEMDRARYDADNAPKKKVTLAKAPWDKKKDEELSPKQKKIDHNKNGKIDGHDLAMLRKKKNESVEQLDELSPKTLKSYQKKADKDAGKSFNKAGDIEDKEDEKGRDVWSGNNKASQKHGALMKRGEKRSSGAELARKKLIAKGHKSPKMSYEEVEEGIMDKARQLRQKVLGKTDAEKRADQERAARAGFHKAMSKAADAMTKKRKNESVEQFDETTTSALKRPVTQTGPDGKTRTVMKKTKQDKTDAQGQDVIGTNESDVNEAHPSWEVSFKTDGHKPQQVKARNTAEAIKKAAAKARAAHRNPKQIPMHKDVKKMSEEVEQIDEAVTFKKGPVRLKDGKQIMVSAQDAKLLNQMFKDLSPANQRKMEKVAMMDKSGFDEIVGFAREAL